jgi:glucose/arabinose dehydrogenase
MERVRAKEEIMMRRFVLVGCLFLVPGLAGVASADLPPNTLSEAERRSGWRLLFDGRSLDAFRGYRQEAIGPGWVVDDGAMVRTSKGAGDIVTKEQFGDFELQLEYRIARGGNSGLMFHVTEEEPRPWMTGPEVQILDNAAGKDPQKAGWLYQLHAPKPLQASSSQAAQGSTQGGGEPVDATRPAGTWNHLYLRVSPASGEVCVNGVRYYTFKKGSKDWDERVAASKFAAMPKFGKTPRGHLCLQDHGDEVAFRSIKIRELPAEGPVPQPEDGAAPVRAVEAFPGIAWDGWSADSADGKPATPMRPLLVTHAGDGSGRRFVVDQSGMIHVVPPAASNPTKAMLFLDVRETTAVWQKSNEEGLLGLTFHPKYRENGEFFICYCLRSEKRLERVSRFRVRANDPDRADPASEEVLLELEQPFANHNGGSIAFDSDGFLLFALGDGGGRDDPLRSGQDLSTLLGKILRIDVDRRDAGRAYAIPADNPFVGRDGARPEIYAYGFRNPWQMSVDPSTGAIWAADVGQDLWEEIDVVKKGGNYGWSRREGTRSFGPTATSDAEASAGWIDPVWEYDHQVGKSITGGFVYRGRGIPELLGGYLYGDHVSGRLWAVRIDESGRAVNLAIPWAGLPVFGFGTDEAGEAYVTTASASGQGVFRLERNP